MEYFVDILIFLKPDPQFGVGVASRIYSSNSNLNLRSSHYLIPVPDTSASQKARFIYVFGVGPCPFPASNNRPMNSVRGVLFYNFQPKLVAHAKHAKQ